MKKNFLKTALAAALFAVAGGQTAVAQTTYLTTPADVPSGYYYVVSSYNENYAWAVNGDKEFVVDELDVTDVKFIFYVTGRNTDSETTKKQDGKKVSELGDAQRLRFFWGTPNWTNFSDDSKVLWTFGGLGNNSNQQVLKVGVEYGMHNWQGVNENGFRFSASNRGYNIAPENGTFAKGQKLWYYANNTNNDQGRWKLKAVSDVQVSAVEATTPEAVIARLQAEEAVPLAISSFNALKAVAANIGTEVGQYNYTLSDEDKALLEGAYDQEATYAGKSTADIQDLRLSFENLTEAIKAALVKYTPDKFPAVSIVTLRWNNTGRYSGTNTNTAHTNPTNSWSASGGLNTPNSANGRIALLKQTDGTFLLNCEGAYLKNDKTATWDKAEATRFTVTGSFEDGLTFLGDDGKYLSANDMSTSTDAPAYNYKVNTFADYASTQCNDKQIAGTNFYAIPVCLPFKVKKPEGDGFHAYVITVNSDNTLTTTDYDVVPAGVPFVWVRPNGSSDRLPIVADAEQEYSDTPYNSSDNLLTGYYYQDEKGTDAKYHLAFQDGALGFYTVSDPSTAVCQAYVSTAMADRLNAKGFKFVDGELVTIGGYEVTVTDAGYATFYANQAVTFTSDVTVYTGSINTVGDKKTLKLTQIEGDVIPARTAVILEAAAADTYNFTFATTSPAAIEGNDLQGTATEIATPANALTLGVVDEKLGFYSYIGTTLRANSAYLVLPAGVRSVAISFGDEATAIEGVKEVNAQSNAVYNLNGMRVAQPTKGLYIVNGKKVILK